MRATAFAETYACVVLPCPYKHGSREDAVIYCLTAYMHMEVLGADAPSSSRAGGDAVTSKPRSKSVIPNG